jgi:hypothetical protein
MSKREIKLLPFHPLADKFPLVEGEDFDAIVADIKQNGQRVPIHVYEGQIIDGRTRALACQKLGIAPKAWQPERQGADEPLSAGQLAKMLDELSPERFEEVMLALRPLEADRESAGGVSVPDKAVHRREERRRRRLQITIDHHRRPGERHPERARGTAI